MVLLALSSSSSSMPPPAPRAEERLRGMFKADFDVVWRTLRRLGLDRASADDAAQEAFVVAARKLEAVEPGRERAFLVATALRIASNARRRHHQRDHRLDGLGSLAELVSTQPLPDEELEKRRALARLDRALDAMPDALRAVLVLTELDALPQPEVAALLGLPLGTVASRLRRARLELAGALADGPPDTTAAVRSETP